MSKSMGEDVVKKKYELSMFRDYLEKSHQIMCNLVFYNDNWVQCLIQKKVMVWKKKKKVSASDRGKKREGPSKSLISWGRSLQMTCNWISYTAASED